MSTGQSTEAADVFSLLRHVTAHEAAFAHARKHYAPYVAADFDLFQFINADELKLSQILAWMLDPRGSHDQGPRFLALFLAWLCLDWPALAYENAIVRTEVRTKNIRQDKRRHDILIIKGEYALSIENKPDAADQPDQVRDYYQDLANRGVSSPSVLYLSGNGCEPSDYSVNEQTRNQLYAAGRLHVKSYSAMLEWLDDCRLATKAPGVRAFLDAFASHIGRRFGGDQHMRDDADLIRSIANSGDSIAAMMRVGQINEGVKIYLLDELRRQLQRNGYPPVHWGLVLDARWADAAIELSPNFPYYFGFEFEAQGLRGMLYGLRRRSEKEEDSQGIAERAREIFGAGCKTDKYPWHRYAKEQDPFFPMRADAASTPEFWVAIYDGTFAKQVGNVVKKFRDSLLSAGLDLSQGMLSQDPA